MRIILDAPDADDQTAALQIVRALEDQRVHVDFVLGVNDAGYGNVVIERVRQAGIPCERWFKAACGLRRKEN